MHNSCRPEELKQTKESGLRGRLLKGIGAQGFSQVAQIFIRLAEVPLLLSFWGTQLYGEWLMLSAIPVYLTISDGGFAGAACREMTMRSGADDRHGTLVIFQSAWILLVLVSILIGLIAIGFVKVVPLAKWLDFSSMTTIEIETVFLFLVAHVLVGFQGSLLNGGYWVAGCYSRGMYLIAATQLLEFAGLALAVASGGGPIQAAGGYLAGRLLGTGLMWLGQRRISPWIEYGFSHSSLGVLQRLVAPAFASLAFPLGNALNIQGMRIIVGIALGPSAVALFVPLRTLSRLIIQPSTIVNRLIEPELALAFGARDRVLFKHLFARSCQLSLWACLLACFLIGLVAHWIFPLWTDGEVIIHWPTFSLLLAGVMINSIWHTALMVPYATNRHGGIALFYTPIYGVAAIGLGYIGTACIGITGVSIALLLTEAAMAIIVIRASLRMSRLHMAQWAKMVVQLPYGLLSLYGVNLLKRMTVTPE